ncbi:MAG: hypothetical protein Q9214_003866, partial [Letrouitia sp. 1 TL-2023]
CHALICKLGMPDAFETVVKDLWALRLQMLKKLMKEAAEEETLFGSQDQAQGGAGSQKTSTPTSGIIESQGSPTLLQSLAICQLGIILLRLPVSVGDLCRWVAREDVPYIRAIRLIPRAMKVRLPPPYHSALDTKSILEPDDLRVFDFPWPGQRRRVSSFPEIKVIALLIIAVKIFFPFDSLERRPRSVADPGVVTLDWAKWVDAQKGYEKTVTSNGNLACGDEINMTAEKVFSMSGEQLDQYLDWYEKTWIDEGGLMDHPQRVSEQLLRMFPTGRLDGSSYDSINLERESCNKQEAMEKKLQVTQSSLKMNDLTLASGRTQSKNVRWTGSFYKRYRKVEELTQHARAFYEAAASLLGITLHTLMVAVLQMERRLQVWKEKELRDILMDDTEKSMTDDEAAADIDITSDEEKKHSRGSADSRRRRELSDMLRSESDIHSES